MAGGKASESVGWPLLLAAAALGLVLRLAFGLGYWTGQPLTRDELEYLSLARSVAAGHGFVYDAVLRAGSTSPFGRAPGYPAFLALVGGGHAVATTVPAAVKIAQALVGACGVLLVGVLADRLAGRRAAQAAALLAAVYPPLVWIAGYAWSEALFWPMGLAVALLFDRATAQPHRRGLALACGLLTGVGILTRPQLLLMLPLVGLFLLARRQVLTLALVALGVAVTVGPWTIRNRIEHGRWMIVASEGGVTFWTGNHPLAIGDGDLAANITIKQDSLRLRAEHPGLTEEQLEPFYYAEAFTWMRAHPGGWMRLELRKLFYLVVPIGPSYTLHSRLYYATTVVSYACALLAAIVGVARLGSRVALVPGLWLLVASSVLVCLVFFPQERFRISVLDPALVVLAGVGLASFGALKSRS
jgi:4-amino-4-deoxy-L-arabinose transferase-like glycosyltransferase